MQTPYVDLDWSDLFPIENIGKNRSITSEEGLYRIRAIGEKKLSYIGQTGNSIRARLGQLSRGIFKDFMPYNDPHTAAPAFWALRQKQKIEFEASFCILKNLTTAERKGYECLAIYDHRDKCGCSPSFNFGRMPLGYRKSSSNTKRLTETGKRFRGGPVSEVLESHKLGLKPFPRADQNHKHADKLLLLNWSAWLTPEAFLNRLDGSETGIYIIRHINQSNFLYIGEGKIRDRIASHLGKGKAKEHPQYYYFKDQKCIELTYAQDANLEKHQRLEIENDLIGLHIKSYNRIPSAQFIG